MGGSRAAPTKVPHLYKRAKPHSSIGFNPAFPRNCRYPRNPVIRYRARGAGERYLPHGPERNEKARRLSHGIRRWGECEGGGPFRRVFERSLISHVRHSLISRVRRSLISRVRRSLISRVRHSLISRVRHAFLKRVRPPHGGFFSPGSCAHGSKGNSDNENNHISRKIR